MIRLCTFKTADTVLPPVEIVTYSGRPGAVAMALYTGSASMQVSLTADDITKLIENLSNARDELIRAEFTFPAIEAIEVTA